MNDHWKCWALETQNVYPAIVSGWGDYEEALLFSARAIEEIEATVPQSIPFGRHAGEVRHILIAVKLAIHDKNPYHEGLTREQWVAEADREFGQYYPWAIDHATLWAIRLGFVGRQSTGGVVLLNKPPKGRIMMDVPH